MVRFKKFLLVIFMLLIVLAGYVEIVNRNSKNMTYKQKILKAFYPALMWVNKVAGKRSKVLENENQKTMSAKNIFDADLKITLNSGEQVLLSTYKGKKILLVNTASNCGYTNQYEDLEKLYKQYQPGLVVIGFPANDFKEQEKGSDEEIAEFCKINYGVSFPLAKKSSVIKGDQQNSVYKWLTDKNENGWNDQQPTWNFSKYLIDENGNLVRYFDPAISPMNEEIIKAIHP